MIFLYQLVTLVLALSSFECSSKGSDQPVLGLYSSISTHHSLPIGRLTSAKEFAQQLPSLLADTTNLNVILITGNLIPRKEIKESLQKSDLNDNVIYHSQVEQPLETLLQHANQQGMQVNIEKMLYFDDALIRFQQLQTALGKKASLILTAGQQHEPTPDDSTVQRVKRAASADSNQATASVTSNNTYVYGPQCAAFFQSVSFKDDSDSSKKTDLTELVIDESMTKFDCSNNQTQTLTIGFAANNTGFLGQAITKLTMGFKLSNNTMYYELSGVSIQLKNADTYQVVYMGTPYGMETPLNFSFVCTRTTFLLRNATANIRVSFYINQLQLQPYGVNVANQTVYNFGRLNYCQGFFSSGIWMAITSSLLLALILSCGVTALMSINTMDRFDDPKGKPLNIGVEK